MQYILLDIGYQEIFNGRVVRHTDMDGNTIEPPVGYGGVVVDANPPQPAWALPDLVEEPAPQQSSRIITVLAFRDRFTMDEKRAIYTAAKTVVDIQIWLDDLSESQDDMVDLDDPRMIAAVMGLEPAGLIGVGRAQEILNA